MNNENKDLKENVPPHSAIIYVRASKTDDNVHYSLKHQEAMCRAFCVNHHLYVDRVYSDVGSTLDGERSGLIEVLRHCSEKNRVTNVLIVSDIDRIARNFAEYEAIEAELEAHGVEIMDLGDCECGNEVIAMINRNGEEHGQEDK